jgi:hypothetical protein
VAYGRIHPLRKVRTGASNGNIAYAINDKEQVTDAFGINNLGQIAGFCSSP